MIYRLYIKSSGENEDFDYEVEADSKWQAVARIVMRNSWSLSEYTTDKLYEMTQEVVYYL